MLKDGAHYLVASLPGRAAALGFAAVRDVNTFGIDAGVRFEFGQNVRATVAALPDAATGTHPSCSNDTAGTSTCCLSAVHPEADEPSTSSSEQGSCSRQV